MKKKKIILAVIIITLIVMLIPIRAVYKDGGTVGYNAVLYSVTDYHSINFDRESGYDTGIEIKILGITVYENTTFEK